MKELEFVLDASVEIEENISKNLPERRLLGAVLQRAVVDLSDKDPRVRTDAFYWFTSEEDHEWGSYYYICNILDIPNPRTFRREIFLKLKKKILKLEVIGSKDGRLTYLSRRLSKYTSDT